MKTRIEFWWLCALTVGVIGVLCWFFYECYRSRGLALMGFPIVAVPSAIPCLLLVNLVSKRGEGLRRWERTLSWTLAIAFFAPVLAFAVAAVVFG